jgi:hypothetical protein
MGWELPTTHLLVGAIRLVGNPALKLVVIRRNRPRLRRIFSLAALLVGITAIACGSPPKQPLQMPPDALTWRRTREGWEQSQWLEPRLPPFAVPIHPLCLAALQVLLATMAIIAREDTRLTDDKSANRLLGRNS